MGMLFGSGGLSGMQWPIKVSHGQTDIGGSRPTMARTIPLTMS